MVCYVKSKDSEKIQKVHHHLQKIGAELDVDISGDMSTAIELFDDDSFSNYDMVDYDKRWKEDPYFKRIKIKDVMNTESWKEVLTLIKGEV